MTNAYDFFPDGDSRHYWYHMAVVEEASDCQRYPMPLGEWGWCLGLKAGIWVGLGSGLGIGTWGWWLRQTEKWTITLVV